MFVVLKELSLSDGEDIYQMLQEIGPGENGFANAGFCPPELFPAFLKKSDAFSRDEGLPPGIVPQTTYWLYVDGVPVGYGKLRHTLNDALRKIGGHIGYCVRPSQRGKGYAKQMLCLLLKEAAKLGISEALLTCMEENAASRAVITSCGGVLQRIENGECYFTVPL